MVPLVDTHCHLLADLDDGPRTLDEALAMCRTAAAEGVRFLAATAHQNPHYPEVTPPRIVEATRQLAAALVEHDIPATVFPCAEVMIDPELEAAWRAGMLLGVAGRRQYLLVEMPHGLFVDFRRTAQRLVQAGVRPILAHAERYPEWLHEPGEIETLIRLGCLVQVSSGRLTHPRTREESRAIRDWACRGIIHLLGSDGHSPTRRPPHLAAAHRQMTRWIGPDAADRVASHNGRAILNGMPPHVPEPQAPRRRWFCGLW